MSDKKFDIKSAGAGAGGGGAIGLIAVLLMQYTGQANQNTNKNNFENYKSARIDQLVDKDFDEVKEGIAEIRDLVVNLIENQFTKEDQAVYTALIEKRLDDLEGKYLELKTVILNQKGS